MNYTITTIIWLISVLCTVEDFGQFIIGCIASTGIITSSYKEKILVYYFTRENVLLVGCIGMCSVIFYTWIRWDAPKNTLIMFSKRYLLIAIQLISLSMLMRTNKREAEEHPKKDRTNWIQVIAFGSLNTIVTLPFAKSTLTENTIVLYFFTVLLTSLVGMKAYKATTCRYKKVWTFVFSSTAILLSWCSESRIVGGMEIINLISMLSFDSIKNHKKTLRHRLHQLVQTIQKSAIYSFSIVFPTLVLAGPWIIDQKPQILSKILWTLTGSRYFRSWSYNLWSKEALDLTSAINYNKSIPYIVDHKFYNDYITEFYSSAYTTIDDLSRYQGNAHSAPIQQLITIFSGSKYEITITIVTILMAAYAITLLFSLYKEQYNQLILFSLYSNLLILAYITTESVTNWHLTLLLTSQVLCIKSIMQGENTDQISRADTFNSKIRYYLKPEHPAMILAPFIILLTFPAIALSLK